jgi:hypothetical protein
MCKAEDAVSLILAIILICCFAQLPVQFSAYAEPAGETAAALA